MARRYKGFRFVERLGKPALEGLPTRALLKRLEDLRSLHETLEDSDWTDEEKSQVSGVIAFKNNENWRAAYADVKHVLSTRKHIERGSKAGRQGAARSKNR